MKKIQSIIFSFFNITMIILIFTMFFVYNIETKTLLVNNSNRNKLIHSIKLPKQTKKVTVTEIKTKSEQTVEKKQIEKKEEQITKKEETSKKQANKASSIKKETKTTNTKKQDKPKVETNTKTKVLETLNGKLAAYSPQCAGCGDYTSSGYNISKSIYYNDPTYGNVRILAGDKKYSYGTIVRITLSDNTEIIGIVLDRGSDIGIDRKFLFDLLFESNKEVNKFGSKKNVKFEILRLGY